MIRIGSKELTARYIGRKAVSAIYIGTRLVWQAISSCFGAGSWDSAQPWSHTDGWEN